MSSVNVKLKNWNTLFLPKRSIASCKVTPYQNNCIICCLVYNPRTAPIRSIVLIHFYSQSCYHSSNVVNTIKFIFCADTEWTKLISQISLFTLISPQINIIRFFLIDRMKWNRTNQLTSRNKNTSRRLSNRFMSPGSRSTSTISKASKLAS